MGGGGIYYYVRLGSVLFIALKAKGTKLSLYHFVLQTGSLYPDGRS